MVNTPGPGGYVVAWLASVWIFAIELTATDGSLSADDFLGVLIVVLIATFVVSIPFAAVGVLVVHVLCEPIAAQWVHVLAAGLAGFGAMAVIPLLSGDPDWIPAAMSLGAATALARLAVVPLVWRRRRNSALPAVTG